MLSFYLHVNNHIPIVPHRRVNLHTVLVLKHRREPPRAVPPHVSTEAFDNADRPLGLVLGLGLGLEQKLSIMRTALSQDGSRRHVYSI